MPEFRGAILDDTGTAVNGATVEIYDINTTTPVRATTTSDASGLWAISHATRGRFDVKVTNGSDIVWLRARDRFQVDKMQAESDADAPIVGTQVEDANSVQVAIFEGDRATPADGDLAYISLNLSDDAGNQDEQARIGWAATTVANGATQDGDLILYALVNGALTEMVRLDGSAGLWQATVDLKFPDGVNLIFGTGGDATINYNATDLVISPAVVGTGDVYISGGSLEVDDSEAVRFGTGKDATISYDGTNLVISPAVVGTGELVLTGASLFVGDTANANMTQGVTINQGANDDEALALKSSDIAHGITTQTETDTYFTVSKALATAGGALVSAYAETGIAVALAFKGVSTDDNTAKTTSARATIEAQAYKISGSTQGAQGADANSFAVLSNGACRMLVDEDGDIHAVNATVTAFDLEDDVAMVRAFELARTGEGIVQDEWDGFVRYNEADLIRIGVLGAPMAEGGLWNVTQHLRLLNGAIWQQAKRIMALESRLALTEGN